MKILIVGSNRPWAIERHYIEYLDALGAEVSLYAAPDIVFDNHSKSIFNKVLFKIGLRTGYGEVNKGLIEKARSINPDLIWIFKGMEIYPSTLKQLRRECKLVNYNPDHPFIIDSKGGGNKNVSQSVGFYHLHFCYSQDLRKRIETDYHIPTVFLPFGYELNQEDYLSATREPEINKVCFLGNPDKTREEMIRLIAENDFPVEVYGHGWDKTGLRKHKNVSIHDAVYGPAFWKKIRQYRVQLNIFRRHNTGSHNMRSFEIPAAGGIQLAPCSEEQSSFFVAGKEVLFYENPGQMLEHIRHLLTDTKENTDRIRQAARLRSLESGYSYQDRALTVYETFKGMIPHG